MGNNGDPDTNLRSKKIEPQEIVFGTSQQDAPSHSSGENLWSHRFLAEIVREKASWIEL
jgi:hypothetical protein